MILSYLHWTTFNKETHVFLPFSQGKHEVEAYLPLSHPHEPWKHFRTATFDTTNRPSAWHCAGMICWGAMQSYHEIQLRNSIYNPPKFNIAPWKNDDWKTIMKRLAAKSKCSDAPFWTLLKGSSLSQTGLVWQSQICWRNEMQSVWIPTAMIPHVMVIFTLYFPFEDGIFSGGQLLNFQGVKQ